MISVCLMLSTQLETSFKTFTSVKAFLISSYNSAFKGWSQSKPSIQRGNLMQICSTGNSYKILENIVLMSSMVKYSQFIGITVVLYFWLNLFANSCV